MSLTISLFKPVSIGKKTITELTLRDISGADALDLGLPHLLVSTEDIKVVGIEFRPKVLISYVSRLSGIPKEAVKLLAMRDLSKCQEHIYGFFRNIHEDIDHG